MLTKNFYLSEDEIKTSVPYKHFLQLLLTRGSRLSSRVEDGVIYEFARVDDSNGIMCVLCTTDSRLWSLSFSAITDKGIENIIAYNKDLIEELENG